MCYLALTIVGGYSLPHYNNCERWSILSSEPDDLLEIQKIPGVNAAWMYPFYCPHKKVYLEFQTRCTSSETCPYPSGNDHCFKSVLYPGAYKILKGHDRLVNISILERLGVKHHFVQYRGFAYDFTSQGTVIHDVNSPRYKYLKYQPLSESDPVRRNSRYGVREVGVSYCTHAEVRVFIRLWDKFKYSIYTRNCQHFIKALITFLRSGKCALSRKNDKEYFIRSARNSTLDIMKKYTKHSGFKFPIT